VARTAADLGHVAASVQALGRTALGIPADLTDVSQVVKIIERAIAEHITGKIIEIDGGAEAPVFPDDTPDLRPANKQ
jgi:NAD(P)-dependent dehydrogenase (short-subunit alcohol dehydrogenase family)